ncbi:MAG: hypothetical protein HQL26_05000 [Candidatus Omnitrophica bacterium]|nr:hypothetical protein [Candidatus Omnitrophota bacterium]
MRTSDGKIVKKDTFKIKTDPHGHGDIHALMDKTGCAAAFLKAGVQRTVFFQDTNSDAYKGIFAGLGNMLDTETGKNKKKLALFPVAIKPGEKVGTLAVLEDETGHRTIRNIEYTDRENVLQDQEVIKALNLKGLNVSSNDFVQGNINVYAVDQEEYVNILLTTEGGKMPEFINPKENYRLETKMQDIYDEFKIEDVSISFFESRDVFNTTKNDLANALIAEAKDLPSEYLAWARGEHRKNIRKMLELAGVNINVNGEDRLAHEDKYTVRFSNNKDIKPLVTGGIFGPPTEKQLTEFGEIAKTVVVRGVKYTFGAVIHVDPRIAQTTSEYKATFKGLQKISNNSVVIFNGEGEIHFNNNVTIDGTLIVNVPEGSTLTFEGTQVKNAGWEFKDITDGELREVANQGTLLSGGTWTKNGMNFIDLRSLEKGNYIVDPRGNLKRTDGLPIRQNPEHKWPINLQQARQSLEDALNKIGLQNIIGVNIDEEKEDINYYLKKDSFTDNDRNIIFDKVLNPATFQFEGIFDAFKILEKKSPKIVDLKFKLFLALLDAGFRKTTDGTENRYYNNFLATQGFQRDQLLDGTIANLLGANPKLEDITASIRPYLAEINAEKKVLLLGAPKTVIPADARHVQVLAIQLSEKRMMEQDSEVGYDHKLSMVTAEDKSNEMITYLKSLPDNTFNVIVADSTVRHTNLPGKSIFNEYFQQLKRITKPGGQILFFEPGSEDILSDMQYFDENFPKDNQLTQVKLRSLGNKKFLRFSMFYTMIYIEKVKGNDIFLKLIQRELRNRNEDDTEPNKLKLYYEFAGTRSLPVLMLSVQKRSTPVDHASLAQNNAVSTKASYGGIDLNSDIMNLKMEYGPDGIKVPTDSAQLQEIKIDGLVPFIIDIRPAVNLQALIGFK